MPIGHFLEDFKPTIFIAAHIAFLTVGILSFLWAKSNKRSYANLLLLYIATQLIFLAMFGGVFTMKMAVLLEQTVIVVMVVLLGRTRAR